MALKGTLKDFGIADIFQLIGQQTKTGILHLKARDEEVHIAFSNGAIVRADSASRRQRDLLGSMLLNANLIDQKQLEESLEVQRRTLQRLGDVLVEKRFISPAQLKEMYQLQVTETIYRLFTWKSGTYEFEQGAVEYDAEMIIPIRSESVLMEGFRRVDEWPSIRRVIPSGAVTFERAKALPPGAEDEASGDADLDGAFGAPHSKSGGSRVSRPERQVYGLAGPGVTAERIGDLSRLGEFESHKVLLALINAGYLRVSADSDVAVMTRASSSGGTAGLLIQARLWVARAAVTVLVVGVIGLTAYLLDAQRGAGSDRAMLEDATAQHLIEATAQQRLANALAVFRLEKGAYPAELDELAKGGFVRREDLSYPFRAPFYYRRTPEGAYVLLPPLQ